MIGRDSDKWYHGSPHQITFLQKGSTITLNSHLALIFSHKPTIVSISDTGKIRHNGRRAGYLYEVDEAVDAADVCPHPISTIPKELEWLIERELQVKLEKLDHPARNCCLLFMCFYIACIRCSSNCYDMLPSGEDKKRAELRKAVSSLALKRL
jgi:hypothetical protein